ncbi:MAG: 4Fe-4S binding protein [Candidatus Cloacimonetes bacterium]|nr:4Fe-4S binding protein [Candidatus Cloacimonadota bacterium]
MTRISLEDLQKIRERKEQEDKSYKAVLLVCSGTSCSTSGSGNLLTVLRKEISHRKLSQDYRVEPSACIGYCSRGPVMIVQPEGILYEKVKSADIPEIIDCLIAGIPLERLCHKDTTTDNRVPLLKDISFFNRQQFIVMHNKGSAVPAGIEDAIAGGAYQGLAKALMMDKNAVITEIIKSGLRGRGGGGFPTGLKWQSAARSAEEKKEPPYVICNASIIEAEPHLVIEGMAIGAYALGASEGIIYLRREAPQVSARYNKAIQQARESGLLGSNILNTSFSFDIHIRSSAGAFVSGESSALIASLSGLAGEPTAKYIHNSEAGYKGKPTVINNLETWANIPAILERGADWYSSTGKSRKSSPGTKVLTMTGDIVNPGIIEVPLGTTLREIIYDIGEGLADQGQLKAVQTGGPSGGFLPVELLDLPLDYESLSEAGSMIGSGNISVISHKTCIVDTVRYSVSYLKDESCGKCTPCREGLIALSGILNRITSGQGKEGDIELMARIAESMQLASLCALGQTAANPVLSTIRYFRSEYEQHIRDGKCSAGVCKALLYYLINDNCTGCTACARNCPVQAIAGEVKKKHVIDQDKCIKCGVCYEVCKLNAVTVQ